MATSQARQAVEHAVLLNMPYLQGDQEEQLLRCLYNLQFVFDDILHLSIGRVLNRQAFCTHALIVRFPTIEALLEFYRSEAFSSISAKMRLHVNGEYIVDYHTRLTEEMEPPCEPSGLSWIRLTFLNAKESLQPGTMDTILQSLLAVPERLDCVEELTVGSNIFTRSQAFSHAFSVFLNSAKDLDRLLKDPDYCDLINDEVTPASSATVAVSFVAYKPILSGL